MSLAVSEGVVKSGAEVEKVLEVVFAVRFRLFAEGWREW